VSDIETTTLLRIRDCGHDEFWLGHKIYEDPSILGLGDLETAGKEITQPQGGRLDILLKNPENNSMYEVELQLGPTDESHIIRTIEYWDNAKKQWPKRSHTAVLVAEQITGRFFNVVQLLNTSVPIIGIQANIVQIGDVQALHFTKVIDSYQEPEEEEPVQQTYDEAHFKAAYPGTLECANWYRDLLGSFYGTVPTTYHEHYISFTVGGRARVWINKRKNDRSFIELYVEDEAGFKEVNDNLKKEGVAFRVREDNQTLTFNVNLQQLKEMRGAHELIAKKLAPRDLLLIKGQASATGAG